MTDTLRATYLIETPLDPARVADTLAGEQSSGTFVRVAGESEALQARCRATVDRLELLEPLQAPSLPNALLQRRHVTGPWQRARIVVSFPIANIVAGVTYAVLMPYVGLTMAYLYQDARVRSHLARDSTRPPDILPAEMESTT